MHKPSKWLIKILTILTSLALINRAARDFGLSNWNEIAARAIEHMCRVPIEWWLFLKIWKLFMQLKCTRHNTTQRNDYFYPSACHFPPLWMQFDWNDFDIVGICWREHLIANLICLWELKTWNWWNLANMARNFEEDWKNAFSMFGERNSFWLVWRFLC